MAKIRWISLKCLCLLQLFLNNIKSEKTKSFFIDFEQIKYDLFLESYAKLSEKIAESVDNNECLKELNAIQSALNARARELWALQSNINTFRFSGYLISSNFWSLSLNSC